MPKKIYPPIKVGNKYHYWTVVKLDNDNPPKKALCKCVCGTTRWVNINNIFTGHSKSCGCQRKKSRYDSDKKGSEYVQSFNDDFYKNDFWKLAGRICKKYDLLSKDAPYLLLDGLMLIAKEKKGINIEMKKCVDCGREFIGAFIIILYTFWKHNKYARKVLKMFRNLKKSY